MTLQRIVSGGQTGVDRGALDAALAAGFPCGGWCPQGREAEDGPIPARYPVEALAGAGYEQRTLRNLLDADGTAILYLDELEGGTRRTAELCARRARPHVLIASATRPPREAAGEIEAFILRHGIATLNIAGPRASKWPGARDYAFETVARLLAGQTGKAGAR